MSFMNAVTGFLSKPNLPEAVEKGFLATSKEGPMSVLPLETSVVVGRSAAAINRGGFLEFQERFLEEVAVGIVWLGGVPFMGNVFKKLLNRFKPEYYRLNPSTAWETGRKAAFKSVDLSAGQRATANFAEKKLLNRLKGGKWAFSVGLATFTAAILIPWLNKVKTEWIVNRFYKGQNPHNSEKSAEKTPKKGDEKPPGPANSSAPVTGISGPQAPAVPPPPNNWMPYSARSLAAPYSVQNPATPYQAPYAPYPPTPWAAAPYFGGGESGAKAGPVRFGTLGNLLPAIGHAVEQTPYGGLLSVDVGLTAGRYKVYGDRNFFEGVEVAFRDAASVYFYMFFAPQLMRWMARLVDPALKTSILLEPTAGKVLMNAMMDELLLKNPAIRNRLNALTAATPELARAVSGGNTEALYQLAKDNPAIREALESVTIEAGDIRRVLEGARHDALTQGRSAVSAALKTAEKNAFARSLTREAAAYGVADQADHVLSYFTKSRIDTDDVDRLLTAVKEKHGPFAQLTETQQANLDAAIRQSFRNRAGAAFTPGQVTGKLWRVSDLPAELKEILGKLPQEERAAFLDRIQAMGAQDARNAASGLLRRHLNLTGSILGQAGGGYLPILKEAETMASWIDRAAARHLSLDTVIQDELADVLSDINKLAGKNKLPQNARSVLEAINPARLETITPDRLGALVEAVEKARGNRLRNMANFVFEKEPLSERLQSLRAILFPESEQLAGRLKHRGVKNYGERALRNLDAMLSVLEREALAKETANPHLKEHLGAYRREVADLLSGKRGRLFSLFVSSADEAQGRKLTELLHGGLIHEGGAGTVIHNSRVDAAVRKVLGELPEDARLFVSEKKVLARQAEQGGWLKKLGNFNGWFDKTFRENAFKVLEGGSVFRRLSQNSHYIFRVVALVGAMLGLGWLVPKLQYALTKRLTGKDQHPGLAAMHGGGEPAEKSKKPEGGGVGKPSIPPNANGQPLNRSNAFAAFMAS